MRRTYRYLLGMIGFSLVLQTVCFGFGSPTMTLEKGYKAIEKSKGESCFLFGGFTLLHRSDRAIVNPDVLKELGAEDHFYHCSFITRLEMVNVETQKKYMINFKPITGSEKNYYSNSKQLAQNASNPYWILEVPAGVYELDNVTCRILWKKDGYFDLDSALINAPVSQLLHQKIMIDAKANQIIYLGDYHAFLTTYIYANLSDRIYWFRIFKMDVKDGFDTAKAAFWDGAGESAKEKISRLEMISALKQSDL